MTTFRTEASPSNGHDDWGAQPPESTGSSAVLGVVREDIRQTLRMGWFDPALDAIASRPLFFTAAWSAMRPNVGKSFLALARSLRTEATQTVRSNIDPPDLRKRLSDTLSEEALARVEECVKAAHLATVKVQIVVHAFYRAIRLDNVRSTGREEPPVRRGVPDWQRWMSFQPISAEAAGVLDEAGPAFDLPGPPALLRLLGRWPAALEESWREVRTQRNTQVWNEGAARLRRTVLGGIHGLPHPVEPQWAALKAKGFAEADRAELIQTLAVQDAAMPHVTLTAAFLWSAFGAPDIGPEG